ncbi:hypothetical protein pb186bvf_016274 [Paramecium bursaria]
MDHFIQIKVKTTDNKITEFQISPTETILTLKEYIQEKLQIPTDKQRLIFQGRVLEDAKTIQESKIQDQFVIHLIGQPQTQTQVQQTSQFDILNDLDILSSILRTLRQTSFNRQNMRRVFHQQRGSAIILGFRIDSQQSLECIKQNYDSIQQLIDTSTKPNEIQQEFVNPFKLEQRKFQAGQWIDLKDTIDQWLEAQILKVEGNRIFVHYNGWGRRWDEWVEVDSPRIAVFRTYTVGSSTQDYMSPFPVSEPDADLERETVDMNDFIFDVGQMMNTVTGQMIEFGKLQNAKKIAHKQLDIMKQYKAMNSKNITLQEIQQQEHLIRQLELQSSLIGSQLAPIFDRFGRMMIDLSPHFAMMGSKTQTIQQDNHRTQYQFQVPITLTPAELQSSQLQLPSLHSRLEIVTNRLAVLRMTEIIQAESDEEGTN